MHAVIAHELAHARRRDTVVAFLAAVNKAIFWFHPLAWWLERRLAELAEFSADEAALDVTHDRHAYAEALVGIASYARPGRLRWSGAPVGFAGRGFERISSRIDRILDTRARTRSMTILVAAAVVIAAVVFVHLRRPTRTLWPGPWPERTIPLWVFPSIPRPGGGTEGGYTSGAPRWKRSSNPIRKTSQLASGLASITSIPIRKTSA